MMLADHEIDIGSLRRQVRLIMLIDSAEVAGLAPIPILRLHMFAYLSNVLAPVWDLPALDGKVLKQKRGPYYPNLQYDLDRIVATGIVEMSNVGYTVDAAKRLRLECSYILNRRFANPILEAISTYDGEARALLFIRELGFALSAFDDTDLDNAMSEDATYSDTLVDVDNVVDFAEYRQLNYTARAADFFERYLPSSGDTTAGEKIHLYLRHLRARIHGSR